MKLSFFFLIASFFLLTSCATVSVCTDYDTKADFTNYKSFAFFKPSVDQLEMNDLDKKRILRAVEAAMLSKGFVKSETPDLLVGLDSQAETSVYAYTGYYGYNYGWGWSPFAGRGGYVNTYETVDGTLYIDFIDAKKKELIWQGIGQAALVQGPEAKEERINEIVTSVLAKYPPKSK